MAQEYGSGRKALRELETKFFAHLAEKAKWKLDQQPATVTGLAVRGDGAAMCEAGQRIDCRFHDEMTRQIVKIGDQPEATAVALERRVVEPCCTSLY